ncbi:MULTISPECIES: hypothetical protein [Rhizobium]|uniref:hypothetical protein n=1 Tax=Rhizobium TaxID=379 RepID=UPI001030592D|nr:MULTISPECIES: hypothetical protein [Rhizobium]TAX30755.1 hypothetical protein ELI04_13715 [Rhizobium leguminosarum]TBD43299.1 hypothetical protein ELH19_14255 [Rhizobium ruizarguesonis]
MNQYLVDKPTDPHKSYLFTTERLLLPSGGPMERALAALEPDDLTEIGSSLMEMSDQILDQFRERQDGNPGRTFWAPTLVQNFHVTDEGLIATMGLVNRTHPLSFTVVDRNTFWVPLDILAGTGTEKKIGASTSEQIVDFLGSKRWKQMLTNKLKVVTIVYDAWARHANTSNDSTTQDDEGRSTSPRGSRSALPFPHNTAVINALRPLIHRLFAQVTG